MKSNKSTEFEDLVKNISQSTGLNEEEIALKVKRNKGYISQVRSRLKAGEEIPEKFMDLLRLHFAIQPTQKTRHEPIVHKGDALYNLTESNKKLADSQLVFAEAHLKLAENTVKLTSLLEDKMKSTVSADSENPLTDQSILKGVLAAIVQVGIGKDWRTKAEGEAAVRSLIFGDLKLKKQAGTQSSAGK